MRKYFFCNHCIVYGNIIYTKDIFRFIILTLEYLFSGKEKLQVTMFRILNVVQSKNRIQ